MTSTTRIIVTVDGKPRNFLAIKETPQGDLIISLRGKRHIVPINTGHGPADAWESAEVDPSHTTVSSITIHPNLNSPHGSVTVHYKDQVDGGSVVKTRGGALGVRLGHRWLPIVTSIGRNLARPNLLLTEKGVKDRLVELWPRTGIDLTKDSLAYSLFVANKNIDYVVPDEVPRNVEKLVFKHFQVLLFYWLFNRPTKFRGTTVVHYVGDRYPMGLQFHEAINFTNDVTMAHVDLYDQLPALQESPGAG